MNTIDIPPRTVFRTVAIALVAIALASLLAAAVYDVRQTLRWLAAAIFLALVLAPAVARVERITVRERSAPRWLAALLVFVSVFIAGFFFVLHLVPPLVNEVADVGAQAPAWVKDFESWANDSEQFRELNQKYNLTEALNKQAAELPSHLGDAANELKVVTVGALRNLLAFVTVAVIAFFLLLEGREILDRFKGNLRRGQAERAERIFQGIYQAVGSYFSVNLALAAAAGLFTWIVLGLIGIEIAVPLALLVVFFDLIPLIGLTVGGLIVALAVAFHSFPTALIVWVIAFLVYQQLQDRVIQPLMYGKALQVSPLVAILALLAGAQILGILGALIAIPVAASIGVVYRELRPARGQPGGEPAAEAPDDGPSSAPAPGPGASPPEPATG